MPRQRGRRPVYRCCVLSTDCGSQGNRREVSALIKMSCRGVN